MQTHFFVYFSFLASLSCAASAAEKPSSKSFKQAWLASLQNEVQNERTNHQTPMMNIPPVQTPSDAGNEDNGHNAPEGCLTISDVLPKTRSINIFASLTRDISSVASRLESNAPADNTTLLAPLNSAMQALPRKPWEDPPNDKSGVSAARNEDKAAENLQKFVEAHVVPASPWKEGQAGKIKTMGGRNLWWETRDGGKRRVVMPGDVEVDGVVGQVGNGEIWALKGVINYA